MPLSHFGQYDVKHYDSMSVLLETYYATKNTVTRIRQKSVDLRKIVQTALERNRKKYDLQFKQLQDTENRDKYRVYGELINVYGYGLVPDAKQLECLNYYTNENIVIPLDNSKTPQENSYGVWDRKKALILSYQCLFFRRYLILNLTPRSLPPKNIVLPTNSMFSYPEAGNGHLLFW